MIRRLKRGAGVASASRICIVAALQVGTGTKRPSRACYHQTSHFATPVVDLVEGVCETPEHVHGDRVHHLRMIELQDRHRAVDIERNVLELHLFPHDWGPRYLVSRYRGFDLEPIFDFLGGLVHGRNSNICRQRTHVPGARQTRLETLMSIFDLTGRVAVITGGNGGIGLGIAQALAASSCNVSIWGRNAEKNKNAAATMAGCPARSIPESAMSAIPPR